MPLLYTSFLGAGGGTPPAGPSYSFTGYHSNTNAGNPSFAGVSFGAVAGVGETRTIIVMKGRTSTVTSSQPVSSVCTIGGVSATLIGSQSGSFRCIEAWYAAVPTGTSGTVAFTSDGNRHGIAVYRVINLPGTIDFDPEDSNAAVSLSVSVGDIAIVGAARINTAAITLSNVTNDGGDTPGSNAYFVMGSDLQASAGTLTSNSSTTTGRSLLMLAIRA